MGSVIIIALLAIGGFFRARRHELRRSAKLVGDGHERAERREAAWYREERAHDDSGSL
jgi:hypothetical protein